MRPQHHLRLAYATWRAAAHVPERLDPSEPMVEIAYRYHAGCAATETSPAEGPSLELIAAARIDDRVDVLPRYCEDAELVEAWSQVVAEHAAAQLRGIEDAMAAHAEDAAEERRCRRREREKRGAEAGAGAEERTVT